MVRLSLCHSLSRLLKFVGDLILQVGTAAYSENGDEDSHFNLNTAVSSSPTVEAKSEEDSEDSEADKPKLLRIRVSSNVIITCSPVFKAMLCGRFCEAQLPLDSKNPPTLNLPEDDPWAMMNLCRLLHNTKEISQVMEFEEASKFAISMSVPSDKYGCTERARAWFHDQVRQFLVISNILTWRELAEALNAAYCLDDGESFFQFSATAAYFVDREISGQCVPFLEQLIPQLQAEFPQLIKKLRKSLFTELKGDLATMIEYEILRDCPQTPFEDIGDATISSVTTKHKMFFVAPTCNIGAQRAGHFLKILNEVDLSPLTRRSHYYFKHSMCIAREFLKSAARRIDECFPEWACDYCEKNVMLEEIVKECVGVKRAHGICLQCLKEGDYSQTPAKLEGQGCTKHEVMGTHPLVWKVFCHGVMS